uniref:Tower domain-containing protein n=1 Tax=Leptobrachium leishanense TaxID=445787 RepID=A0A8C5WJW1_9ANUR
MKPPRPIVLCVVVDLGPISLSWFDELTAEAAPYVPSTCDVDEGAADYLDENDTKTPVRKAYTVSQLDSTPIMFKEDVLSSPLFRSPTKESWRCMSQAGRGGPFFSSLLSYRNTSSSLPMRSNALTISQSLGADADSEMSWTSSLATPPSPTEYSLCVFSFFAELTTSCAFNKGSVNAAASSCIEKVPWKQTVANAVKDKEVYQTVENVLEGMEDVLSIFFTNERNSSLRKVRTGRVERKRSSKMEFVIPSISRSPEGSLLIPPEKPFPSPGQIQTLTLDQKHVKEQHCETLTKEALSVYEWSQLNLCDMNTSQLDGLPISQTQGSKCRDLEVAFNAADVMNAPSVCMSSRYVSDVLTVEYTSTMSGKKVTVTKNSYSTSEKGSSCTLYDEGAHANLPEVNPNGKKLLSTMKRPAKFLYCVTGTKGKQENGNRGLNSDVNSLTSKIPPLKSKCLQGIKSELLLSASLSSREKSGLPIKGIDVLIQRNEAVPDTVVTAMENSATKCELENGSKKIDVVDLYLKRSHAGNFLNAVRVQSNESQTRTSECDETKQVSGVLLHQHPSHATFEHPATIKEEQIGKQASAAFNKIPGLSQDSDLLGRCFEGFKTASNRKIQISEKNLMKGESLFKDIDSHCLVTDAMPDTKAQSGTLEIANDNLWDPASAMKFTGFKAATSKEIKVSESMYSKGRLLFSDLEGECSEEPYRNGGNTCGFDRFPKPESNIVIPSEANNSINLYTSKSTDNASCEQIDQNAARAGNNVCGLNEKVNGDGFEPGQRQSGLPGKMVRKSLFSNLTKDLSAKLSFPCHDSLTESQKAEITELSSILESAGSQCEFTQFRNGKPAAKNLESLWSLNDSLGESVNLNSSDVWRDVDFNDSFAAGEENCDAETGLRNGPQIDPHDKNVPHDSKNYLEPSEGSSLMKSKAGGFGGFSLASGKSITIESKTLMKAAQIFDDLEEITDWIHTTKADGKGAELPVKSVSKVLPNVSCASMKSALKGTIPNDVPGRNGATEMDARVLDAAINVVGNAAQSDTSEVNCLMSTESTACISNDKNTTCSDRTKSDKESVQPATDFGNGCFQTASGRNITILQSSLENVKHIFREDDHLDTFEVQCSKDKVVQKVQAGGKLLSSARWDGSAKCLPVESGITKDVVMGFHTAGGKKVTVAEDSLAKARNLFEKDQLDEDNKSPPVFTFGFTTGKGKCINIDKAAVLKARNLFSDISGMADVPEDDHHHTCLLNEPHKEESKENLSGNDCGDKHESHELMSNKEEVPMRTKDLILQKTNYLERTEGVNVLASHMAPLCAFSTASGKAVAVSNESYQKAKLIFSQSADELMPGSEYDLPPKVANASNQEAETAKSTHLDVISRNGAHQPLSPLSESRPAVYESKKGSERADVCSYSEAREKAAPSCLDQKLQSKDFKKVSSKDAAATLTMSFSTASGKSVQLSEESLRKAREMFNEVDPNEADLQREDKNFAVVCSKRISKAVSNLSTQTELATKEAQEILKAKCSLSLKTNTNSFGFNTASGKKVSISDGALEKVKGIFEQFDDLGSLEETPVYFPNAAPAKENISAVMVRKIEQTEAFDNNLNHCQRKTPGLIKGSHTNGKSPAEVPRSHLTPSCSITSSAHCSIVPPNSKLDMCFSASHTPQNDYEVEAAESARAFMDDEDLVDTEPNTGVLFPQTNKAVVVTSGKRLRSDDGMQCGEPPIKRQLLPEFDRATENGSKPNLQPLNSSPTGMCSLALCVPDFSDLVSHICCARDMQEMRLRKKQRQKVKPQPGSLYLAKTASSARIPLRSAVQGKTPGTYAKEQLYVLGVVKSSLGINSENSESFQFSCLDYFTKDCLLSENGVQIADGGWLVPAGNLRAGKEEFYRALCDTSGVDPKLISPEWVYNHYRWIIWKLAALEVRFPEFFACKCLTPESVLLQLKYRYDVEIDKAQRPAIRKFMERDDSPSKTLVLCIARVLSQDTNLSNSCSNKNEPGESKQRSAIIEVTDGWYGIKAFLDPALTTLLRQGKLFTGQKIITHGAELVGSDDACAPLEAPESLMLKLSANSTRPAAWFAKLGYFQDPRPFCLPLSSLYSEGGVVGCVDVLIQRIYPIQYMEKMVSGLYVFRNERAEEKEAEKHSAKQQKSLEILFAKIQAEFEQQEGFTRRRGVRHSLNRKQICTLQDGAEIYDAIQAESDPGYLESCLSNEQLRALNQYRQTQNDKKQAQIQTEFRKAIESSEQAATGCAKREVTPVWKICIVDYKDQETYTLNIWRPLPDVLSLLKEGNRFKIYNLAASQSKGKSDTADVQLTATKKTQFQQLQPSQDMLVQTYIARNATSLDRFLDPTFTAPYGEVDVVGLVISTYKKSGAAPVVYLSDEAHNVLAVKFWTDLGQLALEELTKPCTLIAASNLRWRSECMSGVPTVHAVDLSTISSNPKEPHLQKTIRTLRQSIEVKLLTEIKLLRTGLENTMVEPHTPTWKDVSATNHRLVSVYLPPPHTIFSNKLSETDPKVCKQLQGLDYLSRVPSPPPITPVRSFVSPYLQRAFCPPRSSSTHKACTQVKGHKDENTPRRDLKNAHREGGFVADEELALINTQALMLGLEQEKSDPQQEPDKTPTAQWFITKINLVLY